MKGIIKQNRGITMVSLVVTVIILLIVTNVLIYNAQDSVHIKALTNLYNDIELLKEKVSEYYERYGEIPAKIKYTNLSDLENANILSQNNDIGDFYAIDLEAMQSITLNYGKDYEQIKNNEEKADEYKDVYIINKNSHNIFYVQGITIKENDIQKTYYTNYTEPDETTVDLRYIDGILIPDGYYYIGKYKESNGNESIVISTNREENVDNITENQYIWQKKISNTSSMEDFGSIKLTEGQDEKTFLESVSHYKGYFKNRSKTIDIDVIYLSINPILPTDPATTIEEAESDYMLAKTVNSKIEDRYGNKITIPAGFKINVGSDTNYTDNVPTADKGIVIVDKHENEFVWIPVPEDGKIYTDVERTEVNTKTVKLNRYTFDDKGDPEPQNDAGIVIGSYNFQELETSEYGNTPAKSITNFKNSVAVNKGYYIGRYEARTETERSTETNPLTKITEKRSNYVYNYVKQGQAVQLAQNMYDNTKPFTSDLMNSYAWDTATLFLQRCGNNVTPYSLQKSVNTSSDGLASTGTNNLTTKDVQCNVYDMASNIHEWTTETSSDSSYPNVIRGGNYGNSSSYTSIRGYFSPSYGYNGDGFRPLLYIDV